MEKSQIIVATEEGCVDIKALKLECEEKQNWKNKHQERKVKIRKMGSRQKTLNILDI